MSRDLNREANMRIVVTRSRRRLVAPGGRLAVSLVIAAQVVSQVPILAGQQRDDERGREPAQASRPVEVNRVVPDVQRAPLFPTFSAEPTVAEIATARVFAEPLVPIGQPSVGENRRLVVAIKEYQSVGKSDFLAPFLEYLSQFPSGAWTPSLHASVGNALRDFGFYTKAAYAWSEAWRMTKDVDSPAAKAIAGWSISELMDLRAKFGDVERLDLLLQEAGKRAFTGAAAERVSLARESLRILRTDHHLAEPSGPWALQELLWAAKPGSPINATLDAVHASPAGTSLPELRDLSKQVGLSLQIAKWNKASETIPVPSVVHLSLGHFAAIVEVRGDRVLLRDRILGGDIWMRRAALQEETSGYFLVASGRLPDGWVTATDRETATVIGHCGSGYPNHEDNGSPTCGPSAGPPPDGPGPAGPPPPSSPPRGPGPCGGMAVYDFQSLHVALRLYDAPVGYTPPVGPAVSFLLRYNQRDLYQPTTFTFSNLGPKWTFDFLTYLTDNPSTPGDQILLYPRGGGGRQKYTSYDAPTQTFAAHWRTKAPLVRTSSSPIRYERRLTDGSVEVFAQADGATTYPRRIFMTEWKDPQGNKLEFTYDSSLRMVAITDTIGQVTTLAYELASDPLKITKVTDPFGRYATFRYNNAGHLESITDVIGLTSSFRYGGDSFVAALTTPYGTTTFRHGSTATAYRWLEATDPLGATERVEYRYSTTDLPNTLDSGEVPTGFSSRNVNINYFNSIYWDKLAYARHPGDVSKAVVTKWIRDTGSVMVNGIKHSEKRPLEARVWYAYPDQTNPEYMGSLISPSRVARVLDDSSSQIVETDYNAKGYPTAVRDPLGRETSYVYASNGIDLTEVRQTTGSLDDVVRSYGTYNSQHLPASVTDAAGETTSFTYNTRGQVLTVTNPLSEVTTVAYNTNGYVTSVTGPVSGATTTLTYDSYGRPQTTTNSDSDTLTFEYDAFDRVTKVTYPDSSYDQMTYERLDLSTVRDRLGRLTRVFVDPLRRPSMTRDPLGRIIRQEWCACGTLDALVDAKGQRTTWTRDVLGRVTVETRANSSTIQYAYENNTSRLKTVTDAKEQVTTYTYALDDALLEKEYTDEEHSTSDVAWTYDANYPRVATMVDGIGTTTYAYRAIETAGALSVSSIDGPRSNDTLVYTYDELGRVASRALNGVTVSWSFDALGRLEEEVNSLGTFEYTYDGVTNRLASVTYPNDQATEYSYFGSSNDRRLQTIHHKTPSAATLSKFDYTYDVVGNILTWQQQADSSSPTIWAYGYDVADQLLSAVKSTTGGSPTVLANYNYRYDVAGNRTEEQIDNVVTGATFNNVNRLTAHMPAGALRVAGQLNEAGSVTIDGTPAYVDAANKFSGTKTLTTGTNTFTVVATDPANNVRTQQYEVDADGASRTFTYDANGNLTDDGTRTFEWDAENRLIAINIGDNRSEFTYDGLHRRIRIVEKEDASTVRDGNLYWAGTELIEERLSTSEVNRFFADGESHDGTVRYLARDHLGSVREVTNSSGTVVTRNDYDPYGRLTQVSGSEDSRFGYTGHYVHAPSGLLLALYRGYDPSLGRWLSEDPAGHIDGPNMFAYVANNPARYMDPRGLETGDWWDIVSNLRRAHEIGMQELAKRSGPGMHNNANDAMRHAEWMRRTTEETNAFTAWLAGVGHELDNLTEGAPLKEILMDLHNNAQGRRAGSEGRPVDPKSLQTIGGPDKPYNRPKPAPRGYDSYPKSAEGSCRR